MVENLVEVLHRISTGSLTPAAGDPTSRAFRLFSWGGAVARRAQRHRRACQERRSTNAARGRSSRKSARPCASQREALATALPRTNRLATPGSRKRPVGKVGKDHEEKVEPYRAGVLFLADRLALESQPVVLPSQLQVSVENRFEARPTSTERSAFSSFCSACDGCASLSQGS